VTIETFFASRRASLWAGLVIGIAAPAAYHNSFGGSFVFDDQPAIHDNPTIRHFWTALSPPPGAMPVSGRPVMNLSLALNYAISGDKPWSYHAANLLIHLAAGLTLFGIVRRTALRRPTWSQAEATMLALAIALLWTVHPLQTESVTYISQRAESLMGLFYLLTLYGFIRYAEPPAPGQAARWIWATLAVGTCLFGMLTKEVMVSAPLMVFLYDRTFLSGSFAQAWRRRRPFYLGLAATWIFIVMAVASGGTTRGDTSGFAVGARTAAYWATQFEAVARYLWLSVWPSPLVVYYEAFWVKSAGEVLPAALVVILGLGATIWALWRRPVAGFFGVWFFAILAPTSVVPNLIQMIAEHRMYLPLAALVGAAVVGIFSLLGPRSGLLLCVAVAAIFILVTARRNEAYRSTLRLWSDTVAKRPANSSAHNNLGQALYERGRFPEAIAQYQEALRLDPNSVYAAMNLGTALISAGRLPDAIAAYHQAVLLKPDWAGTHFDLGDALNHANRVAEAMPEYRVTLRIKPDYAPAENGLGSALLRSGDIGAALEHFQAALRINPDYPEAHNNLGIALASLNRLPEAIAHFARAVQLKPDYPEAHLNLGSAYVQANRLEDAIREYAAALQTAEGTAETHDHYGVLLADAGRLPDAEAQFQVALRLQPDYPEAQENLRQVRAVERSKSGP
jgi:tetratricopeptide (TPR) repeat protein